MANLELQKIAQKVMSQGKGILASDESPKSANKNLEKAGIVLPSAENEQAELRRKYRELFINTPNIEKYLNGIILHDETFWQKDSAGKDFRDILREKDILIAIKVDEGTEKVNDGLEAVTKGLDGLLERLKNYKENGADLAKWRSVLNIGENLPSEEVLNQDMSDLAQYARLCQEAQIVPIVEPDILIDGDHTMQKCEEVTAKTLNVLFEKLDDLDVDLAGAILKIGMVLPGKDSSEKVSHDEIAEATMRVLLQNVPAGVGGVVFLSGGQSSTEATVNLNAISQLEPFPWPITFSYLRAIEGPATEVWKGKDENVEEARKIFLEKLKVTVLAEKGEYK